MNMTPSAQTESKGEKLEYLSNGEQFIADTILSLRNKNINEATAINDLVWEFRKLLASERTRLLSVESMKMEDVREFKDGDLVNNLLKEDEMERNELRQSILSEMEKGK